MAARGNSLSYQPLVRVVARALRTRCSVPGGARIIVAVSGGADSVALLRALAALAPRRGWGLKLAVGHVQHHLREEAETDAAFVEALAGRLRLPFQRADLGPPKSGNVEAWARTARYAALGKMAAEFDARFIATAHHADDQLETVLMRMLRGSSVTGLRGIAWRRGLAEDPEEAPSRTSGKRLWIVRPMLGVDRETIRRFLGSIGQDWREDHTNADISRLRARLRAEVTPTLKAIRSDAARRAVRLADHFRDVAALLRHEVNAASDHVIAGKSQLKLDRSVARELPRVVLATLLRGMLAHAGVPGDKAATRALEPVLKAIRDREGGTRDFRFRGSVLSVTRGAVTIQKGG
jgi:tRNA(Ile)-lysidine synthase